MKKQLSALLFSAVGYASLALPAFAQNAIQICPEATTNQNWSNLCQFAFEGDFFSKLITVVFIIAVLIALAFLIYGGIRWIVSGGDKAGVETARNTIVAALVGLVIVFLAYFILRFVLNFFGISFDEGLFTLPFASS